MHQIRGEMRLRNFQEKLKSSPPVTVPKECKTACIGKRPDVDLPQERNRRLLILRCRKPCATQFWRDKQESQ
jgi:hypothetical protein